MFEVILTKIKWDKEDAVVVVLTDITYQENLIALKLSDDNKDKVIATVSHELRTPLNGIIGILEIVEKRVEDQSLMEYLGLCKDNAHLLLSLVNSLLDLQQIRQGKLKLNPMKVDIAKTLKDITQLFVFQCTHKNIYLKVKIDQNVPKTVYTDENRLKQIFINLIGNALKFTMTGGITVEVAQDPDEHQTLQLSVCDTGIGIKEEDQGKLFKMYGKLDDSKNVNKNGVGLGLTISDTLANILSGKERERGIEVTSIYGQGSRFWFRIIKDLRSVSSLNENRKGRNENVAEMDELRLNVEDPELRRGLYSTKGDSPDFDEGR